MRKKTFGAVMVLAWLSVNSCSPMAQIAAEDYLPYGMKIESVTSDLNGITVVTTGARYVLSREGVKMFRRIDPTTNSLQDRNVAELFWETNLTGLSLESWNSSRAVLQSNEATFDFQSDSLFLVTAKKSFRYRHANVIANAPWNKGKGLDRMWTDGYGGSLHGWVSGKPNYINSDNDTTITMSAQNIMGHMVFPPKPFDFENLYGRGKRPLVKFCWSPLTPQQIKKDAREGFGVYMLSKGFYPNGNWKPLRLDTGRWGYKFQDPGSVQNFITEAKNQGFKIIAYLYAPGTTYWKGQNIEVTLAWMKEFQENYNLDGWYFDNASTGKTLGGEGFYNDYRFMRHVRTDVGENGIIFHHDSVDVWGGHSGLRAIMVNAYVNYTMVGETGKIAETDSPNDPFFRFYTSGYGLSQAYGAHLRLTNGRGAISEDEKKRVVGQNLNGLERYLPRSWPFFTAPFHLRKEQYLTSPKTFNPDVDWPIDPKTGWFRLPMNVTYQFVEGTKVQFSWQTSQKAYSRVDYTSTGRWWNPDKVIFYGGRKTYHSVVTQEKLDPVKLAAGLYEFKIRSKNHQDSFIPNKTSIPKAITWGYVGRIQSAHNITSDSWYRAIQTAINEAADGDVIEVSPGRFYESIDFKGKAITLQSSNPDDPDIVADTIIAADSSGRVVTFDSGEGADSILSGFTLIGRIIAGTANARDNGGINSYRNRPTISRCIIHDNDATTFNYVFRESTQSATDNAGF